MARYLSTAYTVNTMADNKWSILRNQITTNSGVKPADGFFKEIGDIASNLQITFI